MQRRRRRESHQYSPLARFFSGTYTTPRLNTMVTLFVRHLHNPDAEINNEQLIAASQIVTAAFYRLATSLQRAILHREEYDREELLRQAADKVWGLGLDRLLPFLTGRLILYMAIENLRAQLDNSDPEIKRLVADVIRSSYGRRRPEFADLLHEILTSRDPPPFEPEIVAGL